MVAHPLLLAELPTALKRNVGLDAVFYINLTTEGRAACAWRTWPSAKTCT